MIFKWGVMSDYLRHLSNTWVTSSPTCDFETALKGFKSSVKFFMQQLKQSSSSWHESWSW